MLNNNSALKGHTENLEKLNTVPGSGQVSRHVFFEGKRDGSPRVMFVGNSITYHERKEDIGWFGNWGMAASSREADYAHLVMRKIQESYPDAAFCIVQAAVWERNYTGLDYDEVFSEAKKFIPDIIISSMVGNIPAEEFEKDKFKKNLKKLHDYLSGGNKNVSIFRASHFFGNPERNEAIKEYAEEEGACYVYISDIVKDQSNLAIDQFEHKGVQIHPGDKGMQCLAQRFLEAMKTVLDKL